MKPPKFSLRRFSLLTALAGLFLYSASVQEIHYLFVKHDVETEHCVNHLHAKDHHVECSICKIDLSSFVQSFTQFHPGTPVFFTDNTGYDIIDVTLSNKHLSLSLRGPPVLV